MIVDLPDSPACAGGMSSARQIKTGIHSRLIITSSLPSYIPTQPISPHPSFSLAHSIPRRVNPAKGEWWRMLD